MIGDKIREVNVKSILDERPARFAAYHRGDEMNEHHDRRREQSIMSLTRGIAPDINVRLKVLDLVVVPDLRLDINSLKEESKGLLEACLGAGATVGNATSPEAMGERS